MPAGLYLFIPVLRTKSLMDQTTNLSSKKFALKKTNRTNIIATNLVCEQLNNQFSLLGQRGGQKT